MKNDVNKPVLIIIAVLILTSVFNAGCAGVTGSSVEVISTPPPQEQKMAPDIAVMEDFLKENEYVMTLAPEKTDRPGEYTRKEVESFLCSVVESYIRSEEVMRFEPKKSYFVRAKQRVENEKRAAYNKEITKWFEDRVTVTARGNMTILDINVVKRFYNKINQVIGEEKFVFQPGLEAANIVVEFAPPDNTGKVHEYLGETSVMEDNMRVRMGIKNSDISLDIYKSGSGDLVFEARDITYTAAEMEFRKENRLVKTYLVNILDPHVRHAALVHELLHTTGLVGHSPYHESQLFPLPVKAYDDPFPGLTPNGRIITEMAEHMVEMLYRPEILPGMRVKEAAEILSRVKRRQNTPAAEIKEFLSARQYRLEKAKKQLIEQGKQNYDRRMELYLQAGRFELKEQWLLEEWQEIKRAYKVPGRAIDALKKAKTLIAKLALLRRELILLESQKKKYAAEPASGTSKARRQARRQVKRRSEEIAVINDLVKLQNQAASVEQKLAALRKTGNRKDLELKLRRIFRQLTSIKKALNRLR
jgi:hypothetical protein